MVTRINLLRSAHGGNQLSLSKKLSEEAQHLATGSLANGGLTFESQVNKDCTKVFIKITDETWNGEEIIQQHYSSGSSLYGQERKIDENTLMFLCITWNLCKEVGIGIFSKPDKEGCLVILFHPCDFGGSSTTGQFLTFQNERAIKVGLITETSVNELMLRCHNGIREHHFSPPLEFNSDLVVLADKIASNKHSVKDVLKSTMVYGMNYWKGDHLPLCFDVCSEWYETIEHHIFDSTETIEKSRPFCQMVWKDTTKIGCSLQKLSDTYVVVCVYSLAGIVGRLYKEKVLKGKSKKKFDFKKLKKLLHDKK